MVNAKFHNTSKWCIFQPNSFTAISDKNGFNLNTTFWSGRFFLAYVQQIFPFEPFKKKCNDCNPMQGYYNLWKRTAAWVPRGKPEPNSFL